MNSKYISLASIVERVYRETGEESIAWQDAAENIIDVLRLIGVPGSYKDKATNGQMENPSPIIVDNFRGELPNDLAVPGPCRLIQLDSDYNIMSYIMMIESQDLFYQSPTVLEEFNTSPYDVASGLTSTSLDLKIEEAETEIAAGDLADATDTLEDLISDVRQAQGRVVVSNKRGQNFIPMYKLNDFYIFTNFKSGFVEMAYKAYPVDEFGMPMVPDEQRFIEAVKWYLISKIDYKRWRNSRNPADQKIWEHSDREALWYIGSAASKSHIPSISMMESIKRMILRSIPKINEFSTGFKRTNMTEQRKF